MAIAIIEKYFPKITVDQKEQFNALGQLYPEWNEKINVISRKDIDNLYEHHILHSLGIAKVFSPKPDTSFMDVGTGGGFPGIPLAILFPECNFYLIDRIGKKIKVAEEIAQNIGLKNVAFRHAGVEEEKQTFDFVLSRAVMPLSDLVRLVRKNIKKEQKNALPNGVLCLKGGDLQAEIHPFKKTSLLFDLGNYFNEDFFKTKKVVYVQVSKS